MTVANGTPTDDEPPTPRASTHRQSTPRHPTARAIAVDEWVRDHIGPHELKRSSDPVPVLHEYNLLAISESPDLVRAAMLPWERMESQDAQVGFAAFGSEPAARATTNGMTEQSEAEFDSSHELRHASSRARIGIAFGAMAGALLITLLTAVFVGASPALIGAAIGGAAFGGVAGGMMNVTAKPGRGAAYTDSFVDVTDTTLAVASIHSGDLGVIELAAAAVDDVDGVRLVRVDRSGRPVD